jgi:hypothetical protein
MSSSENSGAVQPQEKTLRVTMLGGRGVGKTSLLAAVYSQFENHVRELFLQLRPDVQTSLTLTEKKQELEQANDTITTLGVKGSVDMRRYSFGLGFPYQEPEMTLHFRDYPGEWVYQKPEEVIQYIRESDAIWLAIDAAALMEKKGLYHQEVNRSDLIVEFFKHALEGLPDDHKKLILLLPIKCESYMDGDVKTKDLRRAIEDKYGSLVEQIKKVDEFGRRFAIAITPVQTLGKVKYSHVEDDSNGNFKFVFVRTSKDHPYQPKDVEEVLRYSLPFLLRRYIESLSYWERIKNTFKGNPHKKIGAAIRKLIKEKKENEYQGFKILHGRRLLDDDDN